jgi:hypothetical protein
MRTGAAGVLVGFGGAATSTNRHVLGIEVPMATPSRMSPKPAVITWTSPAAAMCMSSRRFDGVFR